MGCAAPVARSALPPQGGLLGHRATNNGEASVEKREGAARAQARRGDPVQHRGGARRTGAVSDAGGVQCESDRQRCARPTPSVGTTVVKVAPIPEPERQHCGTPLMKVVPMPEPARQEPRAEQFHQLYVLYEKLGKGAFAQVRLARPVDSAEEFAVKIFDLRGRHRSRNVMEVHHEISMFNALSCHSHVVALHDSFVEQDHAYLVLEKCDSDLYRVLDNVPHLTKEDLSQTFCGMLLGITHVHASGVAHRDIKPCNFLSGVKHNDGTYDLLSIKLCDFGLACHVPQLDDHSCLLNLVGTAPYMPPEMLTLGMCGASADVWAFGVCMYILGFGHFPYSPEEKNSKAMKKAIEENSPRPTFTSAPRLNGCLAMPTVETTQFVQSCLRREPSLRPTAAEALKSPVMVDARTVHDTSGGPSWRPILLSAKREGAFGGGGLDALRDNDEMDGSLRRLQEKYHGFGLKGGSKQHPFSSPDVSTNADSWAVSCVSSCQGA